MILRSREALSDRAPAAAGLTAERGVESAANSAARQVGAGPAEEGGPLSAVGSGVVPKAASGSRARSRSPPAGEIGEVRLLAGSVAASVASEWRQDRKLAWLQKADVGVGVTSVCPPAPTRGPLPNHLGTLLTSLVGNDVRDDGGAALKESPPRDRSHSASAFTSSRPLCAGLRGSTRRPVE